MKTKHAAAESFNSNRERKNEGQDLDFAFVIELDPSQMMQVSGGTDHVGGGFDTIRIKITY